MAVSIDTLRMTAFDPAALARNKKKGASRKKTAVAGGARADVCNAEEPSSEFSIEIRFLGGLSPSQEDVFLAAKDRWLQIIVGDVQTVQLPTGEIVDGVLIDASGITIDGPFGVLGRAGPQLLRQNRIPAKGVMEFDTADLLQLESDGSLGDVIFHEMGHVFGLGTIWDELDLLVGCQPRLANPVFIGLRAMEEFGSLLGTGSQPVPVANTGGAGTACGHWRESIFGQELMTGFLNTGANPVSRMTIASMGDLGYEVNLDAAEDFTLPSDLEMALMGIGADEHRQICRMCGGGARPINPVILPEESHLN